MTEEMSIREGFAEHKKKSQEKRATNRERSAEMLDELGIEYVPHNGGAHLVVVGTNSLIDFWPGTGRFTGRDQSCDGRGVRNLIKHCDKLEIRHSVMVFAIEMEKKLRANDHKGGWENTEISVLFNELRVESGELFSVMYHSDGKVDPKSVVEEAADVANFAMMIADNARKL